MKFFLAFLATLSLFTTQLTAQVSPAPTNLLITPTLEEQKILRAKLYDFESGTRTTFKNLMLAETGWSLGNILISTIAKSPNSYNDYNTTNQILNYENIIVTGVSLLVNSGAPLRTKEYLDRSERYKKIFAIKAGVEGIILLGTLINLKNTTNYQIVNGVYTANSEVSGSSAASLVNSAVLFGCDIAGFILEGKHIEKFRPIVRANQLGFILDLN